MVRYRFKITGQRQSAEMLELAERPLIGEQVAVNGVWHRITGIRHRDPDVFGAPLELFLEPMSD